jgi:hypothetical protein
MSKLVMQSQSKLFNEDRALYLAHQTHSSISLSPSLSTSLHSAMFTIMFQKDLALLSFSFNDTINIEFI